jgi:L-asparagine transporter-like permease
MAATQQSYKNHAQIVPLYHRVLSLLILLILIGSIVNLTKSWGDSTRFYSASLIVAMTIAMVLLYIFVRTFPLKAQDRAIRAEEQLRHYVLTGKLLDSRLTMRQIVALRFASNEEFAALAQRAADQSLSPDAIKREVKQWRADLYRV